MLKSRGQEEVIGFIMIIMLVSIISLVFLAISIRKPNEKLPSNELESFLQASMRYSTDCEISLGRRYDLKDLIVGCGNNEKCSDERLACEILNETFTMIMDESWKAGEDNPVKAYSIVIIDAGNVTLVNIEKGKETGSKVYSDVRIPAFAGDIRIEMEIDS